jgi:pilus assembly protein Flp/PilA
MALHSNGFLLVCQFQTSFDYLPPLPPAPGTAFLIHQKEEVMNKLGQFVVDFLKAEDGPTAVEYAVMLALIVVVCIGAITTLGGNANKVFSNVALNTSVGS